MIFLLISSLVLGCTCIGASETCETTRKTVKNNSIYLYPKSTDEYYNISKEMNCINIKQNCSVPSKFKFHIAISSSRNDTVFVCAVEKYIIGGYCVEYNFKGGRVQANYGAKCSSFPIKPCPERYLSADGYKYPLCFEIYGKPDLFSKDPLTLPNVQSKINEKEETIKDLRNQISSLMSDGERVNYSLHHLVKLCESDFKEDVKYMYPNELFSTLDTHIRKENKKVKSFLKKIAEQDRKISGLTAAVVILSIVLILLILSVILFGWCLYQNKKKRTDSPTIASTGFKKRMDKDDKVEQIPTSEISSQAVPVNDDEAALLNPVLRIDQRESNYMQTETEDRWSAVQDTDNNQDSVVEAY